LELLKDGDDRKQRRLMKKLVHTREISGSLTDDVVKKFLKGMIQ
jgi:hypothetical protein